MTNGMANRWTALAFALAFGVMTVSAKAQAPKKEDSAPPKETPKVESTPPKAAPATPPAQAQEEVRPQPTLAEMLARVNESHPDILIAQARVQEAQALLVKARFEVAQKMVVAYHNRMAEQVMVDDKKKLYDKRLISAEEYSLAKAKLAIAEAESPYGYLENPSPNRVMTKEEWVKIAPKTPLEWVNRALPRPVTFDFDNSPLHDCIEFLRDYTGTDFVLDAQHGLNRDAPITLSLQEIPLASALLALEDIHGSMRFVIRDYGILVTAEDSIPQDAVTLREHWKSLSPESSTLTKPAAKPKQ